MAEGRQASRAPERRGRPRRTVKGGVFSSDAAGAVGYPDAYKVSFNPYCVLYAKINSKWIINQNIKL